MWGGVVLAERVTTLFVVSDEHVRTDAECDGVLTVSERVWDWDERGDVSVGVSW